MFHLMQYLSGLFLLLLSIPLSNGADYTYEIDCSNLRMGQYICPHPDYDFIDPKTQQPKGCTKENKAKGRLILLRFSSYCCEKEGKFDITYMSDVLQV